MILYFTYYEKTTTPNQESKCYKVIHLHAVVATAGNAIPVPGLDIATDMVIMTTMCMGLCTVFGGDMTETAVKTMATAVIKNTMLKQLIKTMAKELSKLTPSLSNVIAPTISVALPETIGWILAKELEQKLS